MRVLLTTATFIASTVHSFAWGGGDYNGQAVPGPVAGAGIVYLVLAGAYFAVRKWRQ